jgi:biotin carboxyl carrier protein
MKLIYLVIALTSVLLTGTAMAHGGEDHGEAPALAVASVATDPAGLVAHETVTETVELLLKHPLLEKKTTGTWWLFLADPLTNRPIGNARVELSFSQMSDLKVTFAAVAGRPGVYQADIALPQEGVVDAVISISGPVNDLLTVSGIEVGQSHARTGSVSNAGSPNAVRLAKESQFLLSVETAVAKRKTVKNAIQAFGKITHRATGEQDILAPTAGRLRVSASKQIPITGQTVKKGDVLGEIETIGTLTLRSPFDGVVAFAEFHPGQWVEAGTLLFKVTDPSVVWVESRLFEKDIALLAPVARAPDRFESLP